MRKKSGIQKTKSGHLRYTSPRMLRGKYVHRVVYHKLIEETPYSIRLLLPWPYEVHHVDYNKEHNCPSNLIGLDEAFHSKLTADGRGRCDRGRFTPKWSSVPEWVKEREEKEDEVPF